MWVMVRVRYWLVDRFAGISSHVGKLWRCYMGILEVFSFQEWDKLCPTSFDINWKMVMESNRWDLAGVCSYHFDAFSILTHAQQKTFQPHLKGNNNHLDFFGDYHRTGKILRFIPNISVTNRWNCPNDSQNFCINIILLGVIQLAVELYFGWVIMRWFLGMLVSTTTYTRLYSRQRSQPFDVLPASPTDYAIQPPAAKTGTIRSFAELMDDSQASSSRVLCPRIEIPFFCVRTGHSQAMVQQQHWFHLHNDFPGILLILYEVSLRWGLFSSLFRDLVLSIMFLESSWFIKYKLELKMGVLDHADWTMILLMQAFSIVFFLCIMWCVLLKLVKYVGISWSSDNLVKTRQDGEEVGFHHYGVIPFCLKGYIKTSHFCKWPGATTLWCMATLNWFGFMVIRLSASGTQAYFVYSTFLLTPMETRSITLFSEIVFEDVFFVFGDISSTIVNSYVML